MRAALLTLSSGDIPEDNLPVTISFATRAANEGADLILTPEVTNCLSTSRRHQAETLRPEKEDITLAAFRDLAAKHGVWVLIGSLALKTNDPDGRFANRSFLIGPDGAIDACYDKIHMFDVQVTETETFRESEGYRPGSAAILAQTPLGVIGMTVCYDLRFPHLFRDLAQAGADILTVPAAFSPVTGQAHWEPLLRARAIENSAFVLAPAQTGQHAISRGRPRTTHGHSLAVSPWGDVLFDGGGEPGVGFVDLNLDEVRTARKKIPSLTHDARYSAPQ
jgi:predicted amidohydrolase